MQENNLFSFATKELSQDAVICWCVNWYNYKESKLYPLAVELLKLFVDFDEAIDDELLIQQQLFNIDVLLYFKKSGKTVIVEDKVYTSEHGDQIDKYIKVLENLSKDEKIKYNIENSDKGRISTVYFKTGFFYDDDKLVQDKVDKWVTGMDFLKVIEKYKHMNYVLYIFYEHLKKLIEDYDIYGDFTDTNATSFWSWNISKYQIAQYNFMREIFPEEKWEKSCASYKVYHGANIGGRPWTQSIIFQGRFLEETKNYNIFWRIDTDKGGPYISLRFYDNYSKNNEKEKEEHISQFKHHREQIRRIFEKDTLSELWNWEEVNPGKTENYKEATLLHLHIQDVLQNWNKQRESFISRIVGITNEFIKENQ